MVGAGFAGLSAAVYLGRSRRRTAVIDSGHSMAKWEPLVQNYLGFPDGLSGETLLDRSRRQAGQFGVHFLDDEVGAIRTKEGESFWLQGARANYRAGRVLLATGLTHLLPDVPGVKACLGHSVFFCKDCDAYRVQGRTIGVMGSREEAARYALAMLAFSPSVWVATNGEVPVWGALSTARLREYRVPVRTEPVRELVHDHGRARAIRFETIRTCEPVDALFVTRGDVFHTRLAEGLGAQEDADGQLVVDADMRTTVPGLYAAGCVTAANCQMIIAAGQGAVAAQTINRDLFEEELIHGRLPVFAADQRMGSSLPTAEEHSSPKEGNAGC